jgi:nitrogen fixation/metabolism regulation signal transduction histidine kinase
VNRGAKQRWYLAGLSVLLLGLMTIVLWQTSLNFGEFRPSDLQQTIVLWGISTLVFLGMVTLGFVLFRNLLKLYIERQANRVGSHMKTRLVAGALALTILPVVFLAFFAFSVLNRTLDKWFSQPIDQMQANSLAMGEQLKQAARDKAETLARWLATLPEVEEAMSTTGAAGGLEPKLRRFALENWLCYAAVVPPRGDASLAEYAAAPRYAGIWRGLPRERRTVLPESSPDAAFAVEPVQGGGWVVAGWQIPAELAVKRQAMEAQYRTYQDQRQSLRFMRYTYVGMLALITLFILFVATWSALFLSKQIVIPIERLLRATAQVSLGHLDYRVETGAIDELGLLVRSFNQMAEQLQHGREELDARRRFTEAILEAIPTGVISLSGKNEILRVNPALGRIFPPERAAPARWLEDLLEGEDLARVRRLIRRARITGLATASLDLTAGGQVKHLAVTVSALEPEEAAGTEAEPRGCVVVLEDTSDLLLAQKSLAWQEVAQRVAHEIKNPLTPIALSAERINRLLVRYGPNPDVRDRLELERLVERCTATITREIDTLKTLVDEFSQFARFPMARPEPADLNDVVESALETCVGRVEGLHIESRLGSSLPLVAIDGELFRRAVVNLLDNALEAMASSPERVLTVVTAPGAAGDTVELVVADTGHGIAPQDREKLFLPYFSTRKRGTGLGLAIVSRIVAEHKGTIRVEDNLPHGARFIVEVPAVETRVPAEASA